jgi:hypothetical protein
MVDYARIIVVLLFVIAFTLIGWISPVVYATHVSNDALIEGHDFEASDATVTDNSHIVCFNRTVHYSSPGITYSELYLVNDNGDSIETKLTTNVNRRYFESGHNTVLTSFELPDELEAGEYRYILVIELEMSDGRVTRALTFESDTFQITEREIETEPVTNC